MDGLGTNLPKGETCPIISRNTTVLWRRHTKTDQGCLINYTGVATSLNGKSERKKEKKKKKRKKKKERRRKEKDGKATTKKTERKMQHEKGKKEKKRKSRQDSLPALRGRPTNTDNYLSNTI